MKFTVASSPHIRGDFSTRRMMLDVVIALLPALVVGIWVHGLRALLVVLVTVASAVVAERLYCIAAKTRNTVADCSCFVTGLLLGMTLPHTVPFWLASLGSMFAILVVKLLCGGLGQNVFNPALAARALMMLIFPVGMTRFAVDGVTSATPLHHMVMPALPEESLWDMFLGNCPGSIGEISALALLLGGVYLVRRKVISPRIPLAYLGTVAVLTLGKTDADITVPFPLGTVGSLLSERAVGELLVDTKNRAAILHGVAVKLTEVEFSLFYRLYESGGEYVSREELLSSVWGNGCDGGILNVYIHYLREKLERGGEKIILSSRKFGYSIDKRFLGGKTDA